MEKQLEDLKQQLEQQCLINQELQRQNKDLGEHGHIDVAFRSNSTLGLVWRKGSILGVCSGDRRNVCEELSTYVIALAYRIAGDLASKLSNIGIGFKDGNLTVQVAFFIHVCQKKGATS